MNINMNILSDEELKILVRDNIDLFLDPMKKAPKNYMRYDSQLGNKSRNSIMVQKYLPGIAVNLYKKQDRNFVKIFETNAEGLAEQFVDFAHNAIRNTEESDIKEYSDEFVADIIKYYKEHEKKKVDYELVWIQMKIIGFPDVDSRKNKILYLCGEEVYDSFEDDIKEEKNETEVTDEDKEVNTEKRKPKAKKPTAEEKAAKSKAAKEKKEKKNQERNKDEIKEEKMVNNNDELLSVNDAIVKSEKEEKQVSIYVGVINIKLNYYNFTPIGMIEDGSYSSFTQNELDNLLPLSNKCNINFYYNFWDENQNKFMEEKYYEGQLVVLNCEIDELDENRISDGSLNATGYKIPAIEGYKKEIIKKMSDIGLYTLLKKEDLLDDVELKRAIRINREGLIEGEKVLINFGDGFYAGPFNVKYSPTKEDFYIMMQAIEGKHYVSGYNASACERIVIEPMQELEYRIGGYNSWTYYKIKKEAKEELKDLISDRDLIESFKEAINKSDKLNYSNLDVNSIVDKLEDSLLMGKDIPEVIRKQRIERIRTIMLSEEGLRRVYDEASELVFELFLKNNDSQKTEELLSEILTRHPSIEYNK